jgi:hypothetical protein
LQDLCDILSLKFYRQSFAVESRSVADFAGHPDIRQHLHLNLPLPISLARNATPGIGVEAEATWQEASAFGFGEQSEQIADFVEDFHVGGRIAARRSSDRALIDIDDLVEVFDPFDRIVQAGLALGLMEVSVKGRAKDIGDQRAFAAAADTGDAGESP